MEWPGAFGDGLRILTHRGCECHFPDALHGLFGKLRLQCLCHDATARDVSTIRPYSNSLQEPDGDLDLDVAHESGRIGGAMGWEVSPGGTLREPVSIPQAPPGELERRGLDQFIKLLLDALEGVAVPDRPP